MTDQPPPKNATNANEILDELHELGQNLKQALHTAWESEGRRKIQKEIEAGLADLSATLSQATKDFTGSPAGQTLKADVQDFNQRLRSGEVESKVRSELLGALRTVNQELKKASQRKSTVEQNSAEDDTIPSA
jgi:hypothetical protein